MVEGGCVGWWRWEWGCKSTLTGSPEVRSTSWLRLEKKVSSKKTKKSKNNKKNARWGLRQ